MRSRVFAGLAVTVVCVSALSACGSSGAGSTDSSPAKGWIGITEVAPSAVPQTDLLLAALNGARVQIEDQQQTIQRARELCGEIRAGATTATLISDTAARWSVNADVAADIVNVVKQARAHGFCL